MSIALMTLVWKTDLPPAERLLLLAMADAANDNGLCWPSATTLAAKCGVTERTIQRTATRPIELGYLRREEREGRTNHWWITFPDTPDAHVRGDAHVGATPASGGGRRPRHPNHNRTITDGISARMSDDWVPAPLPDKVQALADKWPEGRLDRELDQFKDYWTSRVKDAARLDWDKTWHNRIRDQHDKIMREAGHANGSRYQRPRYGAAQVTDPLLAEYLETGTVAGVDIGEPH